jgi:hypothetical protein
MRAEVDLELALAREELRLAVARGEAATAPLPADQAVGAAAG